MVNNFVICAALVSGVIEIYEIRSLEKALTISLNRPDLLCCGILMSLSNVYLAYGLSGEGGNTEAKSNETITEKLTKNIYGLADTGFNTIKSYIE